MDDSIFQVVFDKIEEFLPDGWSKMVFFAGYTEGSYSMKFYYKKTESGFVDCFSIPNVSKAKLIKLFMDIHKVLSVSRKELGERNVWSVFTMTVNEDGSMKTDFEYEDHTEDMIEYKEKWAERYLR